MRYLDEAVNFCPKCLELVVAKDGLCQKCCELVTKQVQKLCKGIP